MFQFLTEDERASIEQRFWVFSIGSLVLKRWHNGFDPRTEKLLIRHLWIILPGFPMHCWNIGGFMAVANSVGWFILMEEEQLMGAERRSPRMLVDIDSSDGLLGELEVVWEGGSFMQQLDYWNIPFHCHRCHKVGHAKYRCTTHYSLSGRGTDVDTRSAGLDDACWDSVPLDQPSASALLGKFTSSVPVLLKFLSPGEILASLPISLTTTLAIDSLSKGGASPTLHPTWRTAPVEEIGTLWEGDPSEGILLSS